MRKTVMNGTNENLRRRVLARAVAEELRQVQGGTLAEPLNIIQTGGAVRDLSDTGSEMDLYVG